MAVEKWLNVDHTIGGPADGTAAGATASTEAQAIFEGHAAVTTKDRTEVTLAQGSRACGGPGHPLGAAPSDAEIATHNPGKYRRMAAATDRPGIRYLVLQLADTGPDRVAGFLQLLEPR
ncbi:hypothetical protein ACFU7Y_08625 [Kitasatospora sp. NPDC057542]|uniref:hypothetical protein n=1 Tax=Kitasatospora sp. NPDC057542 TaxID=3346162 RepID=UPI0036CBF167